MNVLLLNRFNEFRSDEPRTRDVAVQATDEPNVSVIGYLRHFFHYITNYSIRLPYALALAVAMEVLVMGRVEVIHTRGVLGQRITEMISYCSGIFEWLHTSFVLFYAPFYRTVVVSGSMVTMLLIALFVPAMLFMTGQKPGGMCEEAGINSFPFHEPRTLNESNTDESDTDEHDGDDNECSTWVDVESDGSDNDEALESTDYGNAHHVNAKRKRDLLSVRLRKAVELPWNRYLRYCLGWDLNINGGIKLEYLGIKLEKVS